MISAIFAAIVLLLILAWLIGTYNTFVRKRNTMGEAWSGVDVQLRRRHDLVPNIVQAVKGYVVHEREVLEKVAALRTQCMTTGALPDRLVAESNLGTGLVRLLAVAENYPSLKADQGFVELQKTLADIEEQIQLARRYYNGSVRNFNVLVESFPSLLVARMMNLRSAHFFETESPSERSVPEVSFT